MIYFLIFIGCGIVGYKVEEIVFMFKGIFYNVIFFVLFCLFVERILLCLSKKFLYIIFNDVVIFSI